jgi:hypothetical protein
MKNRGYHRRKSAGHIIAEAGPAFFVAFIVLTFMVTILSLGLGYGTLALAAQQASREAAEAGTRTLAVQKVDQASSILTGPIGLFGGLRNGELILEVEQAANGAREFVAFQQPVDPANNVYRFRVRAIGQIQPMLWPRAVDAGYEATSLVEHPEGLGI